MFDPGSVHVGFMVDKVALGQVFPRVLRFSPVNFFPPVVHYLEKRKKILVICITELHNKPQGCGASVASAAGSFTTKKLIAFTFSSNQAQILIHIVFLLKISNMAKLRNLEIISDFITCNVIFAVHKLVRMQITSICIVILRSLQDK